VKCGHIGDLQTRYPECEMEAKCPHAYRCPVCGYEWHCELCSGPVLSDRLESELEAILNGNL